MTVDYQCDMVLARDLMSLGILCIFLISDRPASCHDLPPSPFLSHDLDDKAFDSAGDLLSWRAPYLQRRVLLGFIFVFVFIIAITEALLVISQKNVGIATSSPAMHYIWTYGPTAFLTGIAALWARTEYQSKLIAPWVRLCQQNAALASSTLLLDYVSQFSIVALVASVRQRDFFVSIAITVSLIIIVLIILSGSLISLSLTAVSRDNYPAVLQNTFVGDAARLNGGTDISGFVLKGLRSRNLTFPNGISDNYAFQTAQTDLPDNVKMEFTVDGLVPDIHCETVDITLVAAQAPDPLIPSSLRSLTLTLSSASCNVTSASPIGVQPSLSLKTTLFARFSQVECDRSVGDQGKRMLLIFGNLTYTFDYSRNATLGNGPYSPLEVGTLSNSTQLLCYPSYSIDRVVVTQNGTSIESVLPLKETPKRKLESVTEWDIMDSVIQQSETYLAVSATIWGYNTNVSTVPVDVDAPMDLALSYYLPPGTRAIDLYHPEVLQQTVTDYYCHVTAIIAKQLLMKPATIQATISTTTNENRLVVHPWISQSIVALAATCVLLIMTAHFTAPRSGFLLRSPTTMPDLCSILSHSDELLACLRCAGAADIKHLTRYLETSKFKSEEARDPVSKTRIFRLVNADADNEKAVHIPQISSKAFHPIALHPAASLALCVILKATIILLEFFLFKSDRKNGHGNVVHNLYVYYLWTAVPALFFGLLSMAFSSIDFAVRSLAPYMALNQQAPSSIFTDFELLDATIPIALYRTIKFRRIWAVAPSIAFLVASLFTTFSASLFQELSVPVKAPVTLRANQSFLFGLTNLAISQDVETISSLILGSNYFFPRFTHEDLAFPEFEYMDNLFTNSTLNASTASINAVVPAVRPKLVCRLSGLDNIDVIVWQDSDFGPTLGVQVDSESCDPDSYWAFGPVVNASYIGQTMNQEGICSELVYLWGKIDHTGNNSFSHAATLGCNVTFERVDVNTTFVGSRFDLDSQNPPRILANTETRSAFDDPVLHILPGFDTGEPFLDNFFSALVTSPWAFQQQILEVQALAVLRVPANMTNATLAANDIRPEDNDAQPTYKGTVTDSTSRRRVVQDPTSTHILAALLSTALVLFVVGWVTRPRTDVLPRSPTSIASIAALLAGGNILGRLPSNAQRISRDEITAAAGNNAEARFRMGWGNLPDEEGRLMGGENEAGVSQFGIYVVD
ncbi:hypothetical protein F4808DRAFT_452816 [Astrocystis sublimbata]|nr:hypothetical protein F4808DRAFT_452816 [Astrocystis sublimbata]